ncbi:MAG: hypothetical protein ACR2HV_11610 [Acidimicrobiales bacterium]
MPAETILPAHVTQPAKTTLPAHAAPISLDRWLRETWPSRRQRLVATVCLGTAMSLAMVGLATAARRSGLGLVAGLEASSVPKVLPRSLPYGKGMWIWQPEKTESNDADAIVARAADVGLTHLYVRTGSSWDGFYAGDFLDRILPAAHAAGIRVYGWDFPRLISATDDVSRAAAAVEYRTPTGHHLDGFAADIETPAEGTALSAEAAAAYGAGLREAVGPAVPLVAVVPRPSAWMATLGYPYSEVVAHFDAVAPMVYWLDREPGSDVAGALAYLRGYGKPVFPVGQAYDGGPEGGRPGVPPRAELLRFFEVSYDHGAEGVSFWVWQGADQQAFDSIRDAPEFRASVAGSGTLGRFDLSRR